MNVIASHSKGLSVRAKQSVSSETKPQLKTDCLTPPHKASPSVRNDNR